MSVVIVASGGANIASLQFALERLGVGVGGRPPMPQRIRAASHVILPGRRAPRPTPWRVCASAGSMR